MQAIPGVVAVNVTKIIRLSDDTSAGGDLASEAVPGYRSTPTTNGWRRPSPSPGRAPIRQMRICPWVPIASPRALPMAAEILVLDPNPNAIALGVLS